ncbi:MAG TPA: ribbon-helix-helix domain-containing protein [Solirubrobacteraceae bacterium]|jgi:Arc/MetJ-type ribon-helix-helix transcriptional regulator
MKVSVSLPGEDVAFLDAYAIAHEFPSRSAVVQMAIKVLRFGDLRDAYGEAWSQWNVSGEAASWDAVASDGL